MTTAVDALRHVHMARHDRREAVVLSFAASFSDEEREALIAQLTMINFVEEVTLEDETLVVELTSSGEAQRLFNFLKRRKFIVHVPHRELVKS